MLTTSTSRGDYCIGIIAVSVTWSVIYTYLDKYTLTTCIILPEYFSILRSH
jgi:hypothetical protein